MRLPSGAMAAAALRPVPSKRLHLHSGGNVPDPRSVVDSRGEEPAAAGKENDRRRQVMVPLLELAQQLAAARGPKAELCGRGWH